MKTSQSDKKNRQNNVTFPRLIFHSDYVAQVNIFAPTESQVMHAQSFFSSVHERLTTTKPWLLKRSVRLTHSCFSKYQSTEVNLQKPNNQFGYSRGQKRGRTWLKRKIGIIFYPADI